MDLGLQDIGASVVVGGLSIGMGALVLWSARPQDIMYLLDVLNRKLAPTYSATVITTMLFIASYPVGLIVENTSDRATDSFAWILPAESRLRSSVLFDFKSARVLPLGAGLAKQGLFSKYAGDEGVHLENHIRRTGRIPESCESCRSIANMVYYVAKNRIYREVNYFHELKRIQTRIDFTRSMALVAVVGVLAVLFLGIASILVRNVQWLTRAVQALAAACRREARAWTANPGQPLPARPLHRAGAFVVALAGWGLFRVAFASEETEFDKRTFGYFISLHEERSGSITTPALPPISGMARLPVDGAFLVVHDEKSQSTEPRCGVLTVKQYGITYRPVPVDWNVLAIRPNDIESVCSHPDDPNDFYIVESGMADPSTKGARIFQVRFSALQQDWAGELIQTYTVPKGIEDIEGAACLAVNESLVFMLGTRGSLSSDGQIRQPGRIRWGRLDHEIRALVFTDQEGLELPWISGAVNTKARDCTDMYLDFKNRELWISAAYDYGNMGPFRSMVFGPCHIGVKPNAVTIDCDSANAKAELNGFKVEALAEPVLPGTLFSVATDDEFLGGAWRGLESPDGFKGKRSPPAPIP